MEEFKEIMEFMFAHREAEHSLKETVKALETAYIATLDGEFPEVYMGIQPDNKRNNITVTYIDKEHNVMFKGTINFNQEDE